MVPNSLVRARRSTRLVATQSVTVANLFMLACAAAGMRSEAHAAESNNRGLPGELVPGENFVYYDANDVSLNRDAGELRAEGDVFFLVGDIYIRAEKITYSRTSGLLVAEGNVHILRNKERIDASRVVYDLKRREARMDNVQVVADPALEDSALSQEVLGFTTAELAFEASRSDRTKEIEKELRSLRERYVSLRNLLRAKRGSGDEKEEAAKVERRYAQLLERLSRTRLQPNGVFDTLSREDQDRLQRRRQAAREYAAKNQEAVRRVAGLSTVPGYVRVRARELYQTPEGSYEIKDASVTPCNCDEDGLPIWQLSTRDGTVEPEEYVTLRGATLDIATVPVTYTPWLKFPIKTKRQTGLLLPSVYASRSGQAVSQPLFVTLGEHADSTLTYNSFSQRGNRFDAELRAQIVPESRVRLYGEHIRDAKYVRDHDKNKLKLESERKELAKAGPVPQVQEQELKDREGKRNLSRWYTQDSFNVPVTGWGAAKVDVEAVSDNRYLTDFGRALGATQDLFVPNQSARRFLGQEAATEYYGNDVVLSARVQGTRDTFALSSEDTPARLPRVEFHLLPKRYFDGPILAESFGSWERVQRLGGTSFADTNRNQTSVPAGISDENITPGKNGRRDPNEPYLEGDRAHAEGRLTLPLPANDYVNAFAGVRGATSQYHFPYTEGWGVQAPYQTYNTYEASLGVPLHGTATLRDEKTNAPYSTVRQDIIPAVTFAYIPEVQRSPTFPKTYQLFYAEDDIVTKQEIGLSFTTAWTVQRLKFKPTEKEVQRIPIAEAGAQEVASEPLFQQALDKRRVAIDESSPEQVFNLSASGESHIIFLDWAQLELIRYEDAVLRSEFGMPFVWPNPGTFERGNAWEMKPVNLKVDTAYNLQADRTAREKNSRLRAGDTRFVSEPWGPINGTLGWSLFPFVPLDGALSGSWRSAYRRFEKASTSVNTKLPYGFEAGYENSYTVSQLVSQTGEVSYPLDRTIGINTAWTPLRWLRFQYQRKTLRKSATPLERELETSNLQKISFLQLQDCLDITLQRFKDVGIRERYAVWSVGLNLRFLGQERSFDNVGSALDRQVQDRNRRNDPSGTPPPL